MKVKSVNGNSVERAGAEARPSTLTLWGWPIVLAVVSAIGLVGGLLGDGAWDVIAWIGLGVPAAVCVWFGFRGRGAR